MSTIQKFNTDREVVITSNSNSKSWRYILGTIVSSISKDSFNIDGTTNTSSKNLFISSKNLFISNKNLFISNTASIGGEFNVNVDVKLLLPQNYSTTFDNKFSTPLKNLIGSSDSSTGSTISKIANVINAASSLSTFFDSDASVSTSNVFNPWITNLPAWEKSEFSIPSITFEFKLGQYGLWNAYEEVVKPILNLITPTLPQVLGEISWAGPMPAAWNLLSNIISKSNELDTSSLATLANYIISNSYKNYTYTLKLGSLMTFSEVYFKKATCTLSSKVDVNGYPISGSVTIDFGFIAPPSIYRKNRGPALKFGKS